jgi:Pyruvate/2-oxoacid:ferredoxin oxidoreductase delta subunit
MAARNPYRPFTPSPVQMALAPPVSGNTINGLGERDVRRPRVVYWASDPDTIPHGAMQRWFYRVDPDNPHLARARAARAALLAEPMPEVAGERTVRTGADWNRALAEHLSGGRAEMWGVAEMRPEWIYEGERVAQRHIVVLGVAHDYAEIATAPKSTAGAEVVRQYGRAAAAAKDVAGWLRRQGWEAEPVTGPMTTKVTLIPPALACGFGELGKHGSIINPQYGASFRLSAVLTDAPFEPTAARAYGIDDFCSRCRVCENACPPEAIAPDKQTVRGVEKWYVDFDRCLPFFNETHGCAICIAVCPWSRPGVGLNLAAKLPRREPR